MTRQLLVVARKELLDHFRDRRSICSAVLYALMGPSILMIVAASGSSATRPGSLVSIASVFALVACFVGGMNVALDVTAGERDRRSIIPLLLTPVPRPQLAIGKCLATSIYAAAMVTINVIGFSVVLVTGKGSPSIALEKVVSVTVVGLLPLVLLASSLQLLIGTKSRSSKEGHSWLSMLTLAPMISGMFIVFFPARVGNWWFTIPIVGQQVLMSKGIAGTVNSVQLATLEIATLSVAFVCLVQSWRTLSRLNTFIY